MSRFVVRLPEDRGKFYDKIVFPAGEIQVRLTEEGIKEITDPHTDAFEIITTDVFNVLELAQLVDAIRATASNKPGRPVRESMLFMHYLPHSRADRRFTPGDTFSFEVFMGMIKALNFTAVWTFDAHNAALAVQHGIANLTPDSWVMNHIQEAITRLGRNGLCLIAPDKGAKTRYHLGQYRLPIFVGGKVRDAATGNLSGFQIEKGIKAKKYRKGLIIDDICDGGGTFIGLGEEIHRVNPNIVLSLYVSHGIFSQGTKKLYCQFLKIFTSKYGYKNSFETKNPFGVTVLGE